MEAKQAFLWLRTLWMLIGVLLALFVSVELLVAGTDRRSQRLEEAALSELKMRAEPDQSWTEEYWRVGYPGIRREWHGYTLWTQGATTSKNLNIDELGRRKTINPGAESPNPIQIYTFGGSTGLGVGQRDEHTIQSELSRLLFESGRRVAIINMSVFAYVSTQETLQLIRQLSQGMRPDVVVFLDGLNEVDSALENGGSAGDPFQENERTYRLVASRNLYGLMGLAAHESAVLRRLGMRLDEPHLQAQRANFAPYPPEDAERLIADIVRDYAANIEVVEGLGIRYGFQSVFFWQPTVHKKKQLSALEKEMVAKNLYHLGVINAAFFSSVSTGVSRALTSNPDFHNVDDLFVFKDNKVNDYCDLRHYTESGARQIAEAMFSSVSRAVDAAVKRKQSARDAIGAVK